MKTLIQQSTINIIGAGLAGCECAYQLAKRNINVNLYEMKPKKFTPAHSNADFCEIVCSNSFGGNSLSTGAGLLKAEMQELDSLIVRVAKRNLVPAGGAMAVNRIDFSKEITSIIKSMPQINIINEEFTIIDDKAINIIATGPLTSDKLSKELKKYLDNDYLYFYDAAAPIVTHESVDKSCSFVADRYSLENGDYLNCPMNREEYNIFVKELINADTVMLKDFENIKVFEGCMPIEQMAKRGDGSLRFGPLKPIGLDNPISKEKYYAVVQLRKENTSAKLYNLVGFQTNLTFKEQKRVFGLIPALKNAEFVKYGVMHRNTYVNAPKFLKKNFQLKDNKNIYICGQLSGVEGYMESCASGLVTAINVYNRIICREEVIFPASTMIGALSTYLVNASPEKFQPMNANFGIMEQKENKIRDKIERKVFYANIALSYYKDNKELWDF